MICRASDSASIVHVNMKALNFSRRRGTRVPGAKSERTEYFQALARQLTSQAYLEATELGGSRSCSSDIRKSGVDLERVVDRKSRGCDHGYAVVHFLLARCRHCVERHGVKR